jgi:hypothetical protein
LGGGLQPRNDQLHRHRRDPRRIRLILPWLTEIAPGLTPLAATELVILRALAIVVHLRRCEAKVVPMNTILLLAPIRRDLPLHRVLIINRSSKGEPCV